MEVVWENDGFFPSIHLYFYCTGITYTVDNTECTSFKLISTNSAPESAVSDYMLNY
jgi:hypothetical protein